MLPQHQGALQLHNDKNTSVDVEWDPGYGADLDPFILLCGWREERDQLKEFLLVHLGSSTNLLIKLGIYFSEAQ